MSSACPELITTQELQDQLKKALSLVPEIEGTNVFWLDLGGQTIFRRVPNSPDEEERYGAFLFQQGEKSKNDGCWSGLLLPEMGGAKKQPCGCLIVSMEIPASMWKQFPAKDKSAMQEEMNALMQDAVRRLIELRDK